MRQETLWAKIFKAEGSQMSGHEGQMTAPLARNQVGFADKQLSDRLSDRKVCPVLTGDWQKNRP